MRGHTSLGLKSYENGTHWFSHKIGKFVQFLAFSTAELYVVGAHEITEIAPFCCRRAASRSTQDEIKVLFSVVDEVTHFMINAETHCA